MAPFSNMYRTGCLAIIVALLQFVSSDEIVPDSTHEWTEVDFQRVGQVSELIRTICEFEEGSEDVEMLHGHRSSWEPQPGYEAYNNWINDHIGKDNIYDQFDVDLSDIIRDLFRYESDDQSSIGYDPQVAKAITFFGVTFEDVVSAGDHGLALHIIKLVGSEWMFDSFNVIDQKMRKEGTSPYFEALISFLFYVLNDEKEAPDSLYNKHLKEMFLFPHCVSNNERLDDISADAQDRISKLVYRFITADQRLASDVIDYCHDRLAIIIIKKCGIDWLKAYYDSIHIRIVGAFVERDHGMTRRIIATEGEGWLWDLYDTKYQQSMTDPPAAVSPHDRDLQRLYTFLHEKLDDVLFPDETWHVLDDMEHRCAVLAYIEEQDRLRSLA